MLGTALQTVLSARGARFDAPAEGGFDITDAAQVAVRVRDFAHLLETDERGVLINAAAYTNVERAEDDETTAYAVNDTGAANLARAARDAGIGLVHVSTDFIFDGAKTGAYNEQDEPNPLSVYGASKLAGERSVLEADPSALIVRTAWVYGPAGVNFPVKILTAAREGRALKGVTDEVGSPTYTLDLAAGLLDLEDAGATGLFHLAGAGSCSRYELACEVLKLARLDVAVEPVLSGSFTVRAARPANSVLDCTKASVLGVMMPTWEDGLRRFLK
jgi:dTDP-4-dehydrorhamnose reductase